LENEVKTFVFVIAALAFVTPAFAGSVNYTSQYSCDHCVSVRGEGRPAFYDLDTSQQTVGGESPDGEAGGSHTTSDTTLTNTLTGAETSIHETTSGGGSSKSGEFRGGGHSDSECSGELCWLLIASHAGQTFWQPAHRRPGGDRAARKMLSRLGPILTKKLRCALYYAAHDGPFFNMKLFNIYQSDKPNGPWRYLGQLEARSRKAIDRAIKELKVSEQTVIVREAHLDPWAGPSSA
jgi:hypothetical protein